MEWPAHPPLEGGGGVSLCTLGRAPRTKETLPDFCE